MHIDATDNEMLNAIEYCPGISVLDCKLNNTYVNDITKGTIRFLIDKS